MSGKLAPIAVLVQVAIIVGLFAVTANSIECYICDSTQNPGCTDLKGDSGIKPETCTVEKMNKLSSWLSELNRISYHQGQAVEYHVPMRCQKVVGRKDGGEAVTARHCQFDTKETNPCSITEENAQKEKIEIMFCSICNTDKCNGTPPKDMLTLMGALFFSSFLGFIF